MKTPRLLISLLLLGLFAIFMAAVWFKFGSQSSSFGKLKITLSNGSVVYAMRESWGLGSEKLWFTQRSDGCSVANPEQDYIYENPPDDSVLYKVTTKGLTIFDIPFNPMVKEPTQAWTNIHVFMDRSRQPGYDDVRKDPAEFSARLEHIPLNERCWQNFFRRSSSLH